MGKHPVTTDQRLATADKRSSASDMVVGVGQTGNGDEQAAHRKFVADVYLPSMEATASLATSNLSALTQELVAEQQRLKSVAAKVREKERKLAEIAAKNAKLRAETKALERQARSRLSLEDRISE